jgi:hypothetical protein
MVFDFELLLKNICQYLVLHHQKHKLRQLFYHDYIFLWMSYFTLLNFTLINLQIMKI